MTDDLLPESTEPDAETPQIQDPIGDTTDGEAHTSLAEDSEASTEEDPDSKTDTDEDDEPEFTPKPRPPAKVERLQKILAQAGIASRRKAEELIEQGRVQVNGKIATELGTKADAGRDHIRVDGKLLQGAERLRYFVLNKPKGFVTTVKDPEGRPTVMQFFEKMRERLYPVGRLDYMSEGLLLVTNDGELANKLTRASAGVEKTYLVKVAGVPSEAELDILRGGVSIEKGKPGEGRVRTSPARIRQVRHGDNPWYEVVLIEGRNRELRKMFEEIGHFVEKIRRVGYGPLVLDQEPGKLRELDENELTLLRKAADGKLRTPKAKEIRRRNLADSLPPEKPVFRPKSARPSAGTSSGSGDYRGKKSFDRPSSPSGRPSRPFAPGKPFVAGKPSAADRDRPARPEAEGFRSAGRPAWKKDDHPSRPPARFAEGATGQARPPQGKTFGERPAAGSTFGAKPGGKPFGERPAARRTFGDKPSGSSFGDKPGRKPFGAKPAPGRSFGAKPAWDKSRGADSRGDFRGKDRPAFKRPAALPREAPEPIEDLGPRKPSRLRIEPINEAERPQRSETGRASYSRPSSNRPSSNRPPQSRDSSLRPFRGEGGLARPFTTSSGKPRAGGARPSSKPGGKSFGAGPGASRGGPRAGGDARPSFGSKRPFSGKPPGRSSSAPRSFRDEQGGASSSRPPRPFTPRSSGPGGGDAFEARPERRTGTGWKPKPSFSRAAKPGSGAPSKSKPGGFSKGGYKGKPSSSSPKRNGPRPGGKRPSGGKKRG